MQFDIRPFELRHRHYPPKKGLLLEKEGRLSEVSPLLGRSLETYDDALEQLEAVQRGWIGPVYPSVAFGLYGLSAPRVTSIPCALFVSGTPNEALKRLENPYGCTVAKLKVKNWTLAQTLDVIQSTTLKLRIDFEHSWPEANIRDLCAKLDPNQIDFLEDAGCTIPDFISLDDHFSVWKPMICGLPPPKSRIILSSSLESSIGLHHIASLIQSHQIPYHTLGLGTILNLENDLVQNSTVLKDGHLHFPTTWSLC